MEKAIKLTGPEIIKYLIFIGLIVSLFIANQMDIAYLKRENNERIEENKELKASNKALGESIANMNGKLDEIKSNVDTIKDKIIGSAFPVNVYK
jgi:hypothetical protein